jgi:hypothetical protein
MADCGGIKNSYTTLAGSANQTSLVPNFTDIQLFFISFAQGK